MSQYINGTYCVKISIMSFSRVNNRYRHSRLLVFHFTHALYHTPLVSHGQKYCSKQAMSSNRHEWTQKHSLGCYFSKFMYLGVTIYFTFTLWNLIHVISSSHLRPVRHRQIRFYFLYYWLPYHLFCLMIKQKYTFLYLVKSWSIAGHRYRSPGPRSWGQYGRARKLDLTLPQ